MIGCEMDVRGGRQPMSSPSPQAPPSERQFRKLAIGNGATLHSTRISISDVVATCLLIDDYHFWLFWLFWLLLLLLLLRRVPTSRVRVDGCVARGGARISSRLVHLPASSQLSSAPPPSTCLPSCGRGEEKDAAQRPRGSLQVFPAPLHHFIPFNST